MLIWYSQEARSYALLVFFGAARAALLRAGAAHRARAATWRSGRSPRRSRSAATTSPSSRSAIEAVWLLIALRSRWRAVPAGGRRGRCSRGPGAAAADLTPRSTRPTSAGSKKARSRRASSRPAVSFLVGETGHVIAEPPRERYALIPVAAGRRRAAARHAARHAQASGAGRCWALALGLGVVAARRSSPPWSARTTWSSATCCRPWCRLRSAAAIGFGAERRPAARPAPRGRRSAPTGSPSTSTSPGRRTCSGPTSATVTEQLGPPRRPRAIVTWKLAADPVRFYLRRRRAAHLQRRWSRCARST